ncbi:MAG: aminotransferase class V-fold PLP-dependent enzyme [Phycisphaera sp.]|nr:aminotransferase class V-fold PLP-dependent enzyme [Phycisphaera sp.]
MTRISEADFPILGKLDFFNHAGVAPISGPAARAMRLYAQQASEKAYVNAGWYRRALEVKQLAAHLIDAGETSGSGGEIAFVPNTSTGIALVARGLTWQEGDEVVITDAEYPANRYPWEDLKRFGVRLVEVPQRPDGRIHERDVIEAVTNRTRVVSLSHVQFASGHRIDPRTISEVVHKKGGYLCLDAIQSLGVMPVSVREMGVDFLSADGHKWMLGPEGCGIFYCRKDLCEELHPAVVGWMNMVNASDYGNYQFQFQPDARRFEPGSYNIPGILGLGASLEMLLDIGLDQIWARVEALTDRLCDGLRRRGYSVFSPRDISSEKSGIVTFVPPGKLDPHRIVHDLESQNIVIVLREGRLRASPHFYNTPDQIDHLIDALPAAV